MAITNPTASTRVPAAFAACAEAELVAIPPERPCDIDGDPVSYVDAQDAARRLRGTLDAIHALGWPEGEE
jgi:hypothetical protein